MTLLIVAIVSLGYLLIATEKLTNVNKAAVAVFSGTVGWVLYICYGTDFVMSQHSAEYMSFLNGATSDSHVIKEFISQNIFLKYVGRAAEIVIFLLATMTIVEILNNNGCFDFLKQLLRTRSSQKMLWMMGLITFVLSANLDNLTTTIMMLTIMHEVVPSRGQRMIYGSAVVIAATFGGTLTVIGDPTQLVIWNKGAVTATNYSLSLILPCLVAWALPTWMLGRSLPERVDSPWMTLPYRGDDTNLNPWQRLVMLVLGIGGLWFIPTFHNITRLSPFLGALCVLSVLWVVNEAFNRKLMTVDKMILNRIPRILQYSTIQSMLFIMGIMLAVSVVNETGAIGQLSAWLEANVRNVWAYGLVAGMASSVLDTFATAMGFFSIPVSQVATDGYQVAFAQNGNYWKIIAYATAVGGNLFAFGSASGLALLKMEKMHMGWFFRNVGLKVLVAGLLGLLILCFTAPLFD